LVRTRNGAVVGLHNAKGDAGRSQRREDRQTDATEPLKEQAATGSTGSGTGERRSKAETAEDGVRKCYRWNKANAIVLHGSADGQLLLQLRTKVCIHRKLTKELRFVHRFELAVEQLLDMV
jgi:hypothetical protein